MSEIVEWTELETGSSRKRSEDEFLKVKQGFKARIRLIGRPRKVVKVWTRQKRCIAVDSEKTAERLAKEYPEIVKDVSVRYWCWCIERESKSMKILDMPPSVMREMRKHRAIYGGPVAGEKEGCDWAIITNEKEGKDVRYRVAYWEETPLTDAEIQMVKDRRADKERHYDLRKIYRCVDYPAAKQKLAEMKMSM